MNLFSTECVLLLLALGCNNDALADGNTVAENIPYSKNPDANRVPEETLNFIVSAVIKSVEPVLAQAAANIVSTVEQKMKENNEVIARRLASDADRRLQEKLSPLIGTIDQAHARLTQQVENARKEAQNAADKISSSLELAQGAIIKVSNQAAILETEVRKVISRFEKLEGDLPRIIGDVVSRRCASDSWKQASDASANRVIAACVDGQKRLSREVASAAANIDSAAEQCQRLETTVATCKTDLEDTETRIKKEIQAAAKAVNDARTAISDKVDNAVTSSSSFQDHINALIKDYCNYVKPTFPSNCAQLKRLGNRASGVYTVRVASVEMAVYCDMETAGGGWTVVQRRDDLTPRLDFFLGWKDYKKGFGEMNGEFWLGLEGIHLLTADQPMSLRVDLEDFEGSVRHATFTRFYVSDERDKYRLQVEGYGGDAGDSLTIHAGMAFSTKDVDNDRNPGNCARIFSGAWWYNTCHQSNLNGQYLKGSHGSYANGVNWMTWRGQHYSLKKAEIKIRPIDYTS